MYHNSTQQQQQQQQGSVPLSAHAPYSSSTPSGYSGYNSGYSSMQPPASGWSSSAGTGQMQSSSGGTGQGTMAYTSGSIPLPHAPAGKAALQSASVVFCLASIMFSHIKDRVNNS
jgi:hypothetical protein